MAKEKSEKIEHADVEQKPVVTSDPGPAPIDPSKSPFIGEFGSMMYYHLCGTKTPFEHLPQAEQQHWYRLAVAARVSLDKMDKMIVKKVTDAQIEARQNRNVEKLTEIIKGFVSGIKTLRCPKCGSTSESRMALFPCEELAHKILNAEG